MKFDAKEVSSAVGRWWSRETKNCMKVGVGPMPEAFKQPPPPPASCLPYKGFCKWMMRDDEIFWARQVTTLSAQVTTPSDHAKWPCQVATPSGHAKWPLKVATPSGHAKWTRQVDTARKMVSYVGALSGDTISRFFSEVLNPKWYPIFMWCKFQSVQVIQSKHIYWLTLQFNSHICRCKKFFSLLKLF